MEKADLGGYLEFASHIVDSELDIPLAKLRDAAATSAIHTFGWPVGLVLNTEESQPKPYKQDAIRSVVNSDQHFDYWTLDKQGNYYILMSLFEDRRAQDKIFIDTRTVRTAELLLRTARLYQTLNIEESRDLSCKIEYGGLQGRSLTAADQMRAFSFAFERKCSVDVVVKSFQEPLSAYIDPVRLKEMVFETVKSITEMCDFFVPSKEQVTDPMVDAFLKGVIL